MNENNNLSNRVSDEQMETISGGSLPMSVAFVAGTTTAEVCVSNRGTYSSGDRPKFIEGQHFHGKTYEDVYESCLYVQ